ncbi:porin [Corynebacterium stationis]|nr:porin [Corynebacterium stationis]HJG63376.1 porin [Corynebacterium stationis]
MADFLETWNTLSSDGVIGSLILILEPAGKWASAAAKLIGLVS